MGFFRSIISEARRPWSRMADVAAPGGTPDMADMDAAPWFEGAAGAGSSIEMRPADPMPSEREAPTLAEPSAPSVIIPPLGPIDVTAPAPHVAPILTRDDVIAPSAATVPARQSAPSRVDEPAPSVPRPSANDRKAPPTL